MSTLLMEPFEAKPRRHATNFLSRVTDRSVRKLVDHFTTRLMGPDVPRFELELPNGMVRRLGASNGAGTAEVDRFRLRIRSQEGLRALASFDEARTAAAFMNGDFDIDGDFLAALELRQYFQDRHPLWSLWRFVRPFLVGQVQADKRDIPRHYDFGDEFYFSFLDRDVRLYSQALYESDSDSLEQAARHKLDYILSACRLQPGCSVLDVGAGWGSFACYAAERGVNVTMMTLAHRQFEHLSSMARASSRPGLLDVVRESIYAYAPNRRFDAIVLLGVMEHLPDYLALCRQFDVLLEANGRVSMDFSAVRKKYDSSSVAYRHVFPGNHTPVVLHELLGAANGSTFEAIEVQNDRHSYFLTLAEWAHRLEAGRARLIPEYGQRTFRLFQLYLWATAHAMAIGTLESYRVVIQRALESRSTDVGLARG